MTKETYKAVRERAYALEEKIEAGSGPAACCAALIVKWRAQADRLRRKYRDHQNTELAERMFENIQVLEDCAADLHQTLAQHNDQALPQGGAKKGNEYE